MKYTTCSICNKLIANCNIRKHLIWHDNHTQPHKPHQSVQHDGLNCIYCGKLCKNKNSLAQHECRCKQNPNKIIISSIAWNKGLSKETDSRVQKNADSICKAWADGKYTNAKWSHESHAHSYETKLKLREVAINRGLGGHTYIKSYEYNGIYFDSSWEIEVAKSLDDNNIKWIRPDRLFYKDNENKKRYYFPDFYLVDYDVYLDPKNDYLLNNPHSGHNYSDKEKINWVMQQNDCRIITLSKDQLCWDAIKTLI